MPISFNDVSIVGYNASPPADDGSAISSNQVSWSKHLDKIGGPLKTAFEELNAELITAFGLGAAQADVALKAAANTFTAAQTISMSQAIFDLVSTGANTPVLRGWVSSSHKGGFGIVPTAGGWGTGSGAFDTLIYSVASGLTISLDNGATVALRMNTTGAITATPNASAAEIGYKGSPINEQADDYSLVLADTGKTIYLTFAGTKTLTIPANASVAFPVGTIIVVISGCSGGLSIAITSDTLYLAGSGFGTTGTRTLAYGGIATIQKIQAAQWLISGTGLS